MGIPETVVNEFVGRPFGESIFLFVVIGIIILVILWVDRAKNRSVWKSMMTSQMGMFDERFRANSGEHHKEFDDKIIALKEEREKKMSEANGEQNVEIKAIGGTLTKLSGDIGEIKIVLHEYAKVFKDFKRVNRDVDGEMQLILSEAFGIAFKGNDDKLKELIAYKAKTMRTLFCDLLSLNVKKLNSTVIKVQIDVLIKDIIKEITEISSKEFAEYYFSKQHFCLVESLKDSIEYYLNPSNKLNNINVPAELRNKFIDFYRRSLENLINSWIDFNKK